MQGIKSCYITKTISLEIAWATLLGHGSPKQLLEAHTKKNMVVLPRQDQLHQSHGPGNEAIRVPGGLSNPMAFWAVLVFTYEEVFGQFGHRKASTKGISTDCKVIMLSIYELIQSRMIDGIKEWRWLRSCYVKIGLFI